MKIKKTINESIEETKLTENIITEAEETSDEDNIIDDVLSASVSEIADAVQAAAEEASEGEETYSDAKAEKTAAAIEKNLPQSDRGEWNKAAKDHPVWLLRISSF